MALQSALFKGDPKLEAAAISDSAHILPGSAGLHVSKIQQALIQLDGADITQDSAYGPATAAAVLAYKQKRNIVNTSFQTTPDNIVGKMTIAALDLEMKNAEAPRTPVHIRPLSLSRLRQPRSPAILALLKTPNTSLNFAIGSAAATGPIISAGPSFGPTSVLEIRRNSTGVFMVENGSFGDVVIADPSIAKIAPAQALVPPADRALVVDDQQTFKVFSGKTLGRTTITATVSGSTASIDVVVKTFFTRPKFVPGVNHSHKPSGRYTEVQANPNNGPGLQGFILEKACPLTDPLGLVGLAKRAVFSDKPIALKHLNHYLTNGKGADFVENDNIRDWLQRDSGIKRRLKQEIFSGRGRPKGEGFFFFDQGSYALEDFQFAFGDIDRVDYEVDFSQDTVRVFFQDRYEWHPFYPFYDFQPGDGLRQTNCLHAALVELKTSGAADFWMKGEAEVALSVIAKS